MPLESRAILRFFFTILFLSITGILYSQSELISFFSSIAGERNFVIDSSLYFHVYNKEKNSYADFEMEIFAVVRNMEDFYIKVKKPKIIDGITFIYFSDSNRIYSGYGNKFYMDSVETSGDVITKTVKEALDVLSSPFFIYRKKVEEGITFYTFSLSSALFLKRLGIEPVSVSVVFNKNKLKEVAIYGERNEYVKLILNEFLVGINVDKYFKLPGS